MNKSRILDQFYTKQEIANTCLEKALNIIKKENLIFDTYLEPSAGTGAFFNILPENKIGIDLEPKTANVIQSDFFEYDKLQDIYFTIGNPPFGKNSSLAIRFFNKCATVSVGIGFIVPKTFKKDSVKNKLDAYFHLFYEKDLPENSFEFDDQEKDVPCVFQIWLKKDYPRLKTDRIGTTDFSFEKDRNQADFAFQRVGVNAGRIKNINDMISSSSHYFIKENKNGIRVKLESIDWNQVKHNTAGNPSISKQELISLYTKNIEGITK